MKITFQSNFEWENVVEKPYKKNDGSFKDVKRYEIVKGEEIELRYFEIKKGGYSSLEKHQHEHIVMFLKGEGSVLVGDKVYDVKAFDVIHIPPLEPHRFIAHSDLGFICCVRKDRDKPQLLSEEEINKLILKNEEVKKFIR